MGGDKATVTMCRQFGELMKDAFKRSMVWMWPNGTIDMSCPEQWRDLVRVFSMGWIEALKSVGHYAEIEQQMIAYNAICDPNWMPDASWDWTSMCDQSRN